jgi:hypothetical protein
MQAATRRGEDAASAPRAQLNFASPIARGGGAQQGSPLRGSPRGSPLDASSSPSASPSPSLSLSLGSVLTVGHDTTRLPAAALTKTPRKLLGKLSARLASLRNLTDMAAELEATQLAGGPRAVAALIMR